MSDQDLPYGKLSSTWGFIVVITLLPLSIILISMMTKHTFLDRPFYTLFLVYLMAHIFNRIPIGYRWINNLENYLERAFFLVLFLASAYLVVSPSGISAFYTILILVVALVGCVYDFTSLLAQRREEFSLINRFTGALASLICILPMPIFIYLNQWPIQP